MDIKKCYPYGKKKAFTLSYDDGVVYDVPLLEIMNRTKIRGTFNLNSGLQTQDSFWETQGVVVHRMDPDGLPDLYRGHEVAVHTATHPHLEALTEEEMEAEVVSDRDALTQRFGYPVRGMAYPFGTYNDMVLQVLKRAGIAYSRTVRTTGRFDLPKDFLQWDATCHHNAPELLEYVDAFLKTDQELALFYVWGHSYEFECNQNWSVAKALCEKMAGQPDVWYATNIEIYDYLQAANQLKRGDNWVENPAKVPVWIQAGRKVIMLKPGERNVQTENEK